MARRKRDRSKIWRWLGFSSIALLTVGCGSKEKENVEPKETVGTSTAEGIRFEDRTQSFGIQSTYRTGEESKQYSIAEGLGGGVAMFDYDLNGRLDLLFAGGGTIEANQPLKGLPNSLWSNVGAELFRDSSRTSRIEAAKYYSHAILPADVDNDGFSDVLVTGYGGLQFYRNQGDGTFVECAVEMGLVDDSWSTSAAWVDLNEDGVLDLYVAHYVNWSWANNPTCGTPGKQDRCTPYQFDGLNDAVFIAVGDGTFQRFGQELGLVENGKGLGVVAGELTGDRKADVYVANDTTNNFFFEGQQGGKLKEIGLINGTGSDERGVPNGSMGIAVLDFNLDLQPDLWVTNFENETCAMYQNVGGGNFRHVSNSVGANALGKLFVGFGTVAGDFDWDGDEDLAIANGHIQYFANLAQEQLILRNEAGKRLVRQKMDDTYFSAKHIGRGLVTGDLDGDGRLDLVFSNTSEPAAVLMNRSETKGRSWVGLRLVGTRGSRDAIGASVLMKCSDGTRLRQVCSGGSYLSQNPLNMHWAVPEGSDNIEFEIHWPSGEIERSSGHSAGHEVIAIEPNGM